MSRGSISDDERVGGGASATSGVGVVRDERVRAPSTPQRALTVLLLAVGAPLQLCALFFSSGDILLSVFGLYVAATIVVVTSRYFMQELAFERSVDFSLHIFAVMCASLIVSHSLGTSLHYWSIYANPLRVEPTTLKRPLRDAVRHGSTRCAALVLPAYRN